MSTSLDKPRDLALMEELPDLLTIQEVAGIARVSRQTVSRLIKDGKLRALHIGPQTIRVRRSDLEDFIQRNTSFGGDAA